MTVISEFLTEIHSFHGPQGRVEKDFFFNSPATPKNGSNVPSGPNVESEKTLSVLVRKTSIIPGKSLVRSYTIFDKDSVASETETYKLDRTSGWTASFCKTTEVSAVIFSRKSGASTIQQRSNQYNGTSARVLEAISFSRAAKPSVRVLNPRRKEEIVYTPGFVSKYWRVIPGLPSDHPLNRPLESPNDPDQYSEVVSECSLITEAGEDTAYNERTVLESVSEVDNEEEETETARTA